MSAWWCLDGIVKSNKKNFDTIAAILQDNGCEVSQGSEEYSLEFSYSGDNLDDFAQTLAEWLSPLAQEGDIIAEHDDCPDSLRMYSFENGYVKFYRGTTFQYFDQPDRFVAELPREIIDAVLRKYGNQSEQKAPAHTRMHT